MRACLLEEGREEAGGPVVQWRPGARPRPHAPPAQSGRNQARVILLQTLAPPVRPRGKHRNQKRKEKKDVESADRLREWLSFPPGTHQMAAPSRPCSNRASSDGSSDEGPVCV